MKIEQRYSVMDQIVLLGIRNLLVTLQALWQYKDNLGEVPDHPGQPSRPAWHSAPNAGASREFSLGMLFQCMEMTLLATWPHKYLLVAWTGSVQHWEQVLMRSG